MMRSVRPFAAAMALAAAAASLLAPLAAQHQPVTLLAAARGAHVVVAATVVAATDPAPEWHRLEFRTDDVLAGTVGEHFALLEPAGRCCGRSLQALAAGERCLLFLERRGPALHPFGGARGVLPWSQELVAHTRSLLGTPDASLPGVLVPALANDGRIAADAAHALAALPVLQLDAAAKEAVLQHLHDAVQRGAVAAAPLADVVVRTRDAAAIERLLPLYLDTTRPDHARLLRGALVRTGLGELPARLAPHLRPDERCQLRAADLLAELHTAEAEASLHQLLAGAQSLRVQLRVVETLLAEGTLASSLPSSVPAAVVQLAKRRLAAPRVFRCIDPHRR